MERRKFHTSSPRSSAACAAMPRLRLRHCARAVTVASTWRSKRADALSLKNKKKTSCSEPLEKFSAEVAVTATFYPFIRTHARALIRAATGEVSNVRRVASAPKASSWAMAPWSAEAQAQCSAVRPPLSVAFTSAPCTSSART